jgi:hypothetical protein
MRSAMRYRAAVLWAGVAAFAVVSPAAAQAPGYPPPPSYPPPPGYPPPPSYPPPPQAPVYPAPPPVAPGSPQAAEIAHCLCLQQAVSALNADMIAKQRAYDAVRDELARLDSQLQSARASMDVNNPQSVAQFRELLERRDAAFKRSTGLVTGDLSSATARYNARTNEYNSRCANQPRDPALLSQVQATLTCPPLY